MTPRINLFAGTRDGPTPINGFHPAVPTEPAKSGLTLAEFVEEWRRDVAVNLKVSTTRAAESHLRAHIIPKLGSLHLTETTTRTVQGFVAHLASGGLSHKTVENVLLTLSSHLRTARAWGYRCGDFRFRDLTLPREGVKAEPRCFADDEVRRDLLAESKKQKAWKRLCAIPSIGPIRAAVLLGILQTPHRFRTKRPLWNYGGLAIEMHSSADHRRVDGQLQRSRKNVLVRGLNRNCNHDLKNLFKGAAAVASSKPGPFQEFYTALLAKGMRPEMARLTLARKIATIVLIVWKRGVCFDAQHLKPQTA